MLRLVRTSCMQWSVSPPQPPPAANGGQQWPLASSASLATGQQHLTGLLPTHWTPPPSTSLLALEKWKKKQWRKVNNNAISVTRQPMVASSASLATGYQHLTGLRLLTHQAPPPSTSSLAVALESAQWRKIQKMQKDKAGKSVRNSPSSSKCLCSIWTTNIFSSNLERETTERQTSEFPSKPRCLKVDTNETNEPYVIVQRSRQSKSRHWNSRH